MISSPSHKKVSPCSFERLPTKIVQFCCSPMCSLSPSPCCHSHSRHLRLRITIASTRRFLLTLRQNIVAASQPEGSGGDAASALRSQDGIPLGVVRGRRTEPARPLTTRSNTPLGGVGTHREDSTVRRKGDAAGRGSRRERQWLNR